MKKIFDDTVSSMILSASGWRTVFALSGNEEDGGERISAEKQSIAVLAGTAFARYMTGKKGKGCTVVVGTDTRPTGSAIAECIIRALLRAGLNVYFVGISAAPEIMAYARKADGFAYISASHNPIGHNGIKFGLSDGGVIPAQEAAVLIQSFKDLCASQNPEQDAQNIINECPRQAFEAVYAESAMRKKEALNAYREFTEQVVSGETDTDARQRFLHGIKNAAQKQNLGVVCDMNGSARTVSIDKTFLTENGIEFYAINDKPGAIAHAIIPEPENLVYCAREMEKLHAQGKSGVLFGYMPDCDGDRGNIVYWNEEKKCADILRAQEVFALSVLSELAFNFRKHADVSLSTPKYKCAVSVNCPTSMRIEDIGSAFGALVSRSEVGEANVVNRARELRSEGYDVPILGEGSNGGNITHPAAVRDPMNTLFALLKLLTIRDTDTQIGLFHLWCTLSGQEKSYKDDFTLSDVIRTLPAYTTTGVSEKRALLNIQNGDHVQLKRNFQKIFCAQWEEKKEQLKKKYGIVSWKAFATVGTKEIAQPDDFGISGKGGLKITFQNEKGENSAFIWMRGSGTEPVFRILCDVKGDNSTCEKELLQWETDMLVQADNS